MNLDAYIQKQSHQFDTFRQQFCLGPADQLAARPDSILTERWRPSAGKGRTSSTSSFRDIMVSIDDEEPEQPREAPILNFTPTVRHLDVAPWITSEPDSQDMSKKTKKTSFFRRFRRGSSRVPSDSSSMTADSVVGDHINLAQKTSNGRYSRDHSPSEFSIAEHGTSSTTANEQRRVVMEEPPVELAPPLCPVSVLDGHHNIAFGPIDPNILSIRQPVEVPPEERQGMKPSSSTPQIKYDLESETNQGDRMSRMFDGICAQ